MIVRDLEGNEYKWPPTGFVPLENETKKSSHHLRARNLLKRLLGSVRIMEEVPLPGTKLRLDFYIHLLGLAVEVHGEQHYAYSSFFHENAWGYLRSKGNDRLKKEWCRINDIKLIEFPYNESCEEWTIRMEPFLINLNE